MRSYFRLWLPCSRPAWAAASRARAGIFTALNAENVAAIRRTERAIGPICRGEKFLRNIQPQTLARIFGGN